LAWSSARGRSRRCRQSARRAIARRRPGPVRVFAQAQSDGQQAPRRASNQRTANPLDGALQPADHRGRQRLQRFGGGQQARGWAARAAKARGCSSQSNPTRLSSAGRLRKLVRPAGLAQGQRGFQGKLPAVPGRARHSTPGGRTAAQTCAWVTGSKEENPPRINPAGGPRGKSRQKLGHRLLLGFGCRRQRLLGGSGWTGGQRGGAKTKKKNRAAPKKLSVWGKI